MIIHTINPVATPVTGMLTPGGFSSGSGCLSRPGCSSGLECWDNAQHESFWSTLKTEFYDRHEFATHAQAIQAISTWIETVYNRRRRHSTLGQIPPR